MANTYYDSQLTAEEIEQILEAINGILTPANNGKVLAISNGKFEARSVQWGGGEAVLEPLSVTENGDYYPEAGVDGFDEVHVAVPSSSPTIQSLSVTQNGTYTAPSGVDGYSPISVNVPSGGSGAEVDTSQLAFQVNTSISSYTDNSMNLSVTGNYLYEGADIEISGLVVGKKYALKFTIQHTIGGYLGSQYTYGFKISDSVASSYDQYSNWPNNLDRDNASHVVYLEFTATSNTMYWSFNYSAFESTAHIIIISNIFITELLLQSKTVTMNGLITPDSGYYGLSEVTVNVQSSVVDHIDTIVMPNASRLVGVAIDGCSTGNNTMSIVGHEFSAGYEGFNLHITDLEIGETYQIGFSFQTTSGAFLNQYTFGFKLSDTEVASYPTSSGQAPDYTVIPRDLDKHDFTQTFTATAETMYLVFAMPGYSDSYTNYFEITGLHITDL